MWKIGLKNSKELSNASSNQKYRPFDDNSILENELSNCGSPRNLPRQSNNSETKFSIFAEIKKIQDKKLMQDEKKSIQFRSPIPKNQRRRISNLQLIHNNHFDSDEKVSENDKFEKKLLFQQKFGISQSRSNKRLKFYTKQSEIQNQKVQRLSIQYTSEQGLQNPLKKRQFKKNENITTDNLKQTIHVNYEKLKMQILNLKQFQIQLVSYIQNQLNTFNKFYLDMQKQLINICSQYRNSFKPTESQIQQSTVKSKQINQLLSKLEKKQLEITNRLAWLNEREELIGKWQEIKLTDRDLKEKQKNIELQQKRLENRLRELQIKQQTILNKEKNIQKKISERNFNQQIIKQKKHKAFPTSKHSKHKVNKQLHPIENKIPVNINSLLNAIHEMKINLDDISYYNQKFSKTFERSRSQSYLLQNNLKK